METMFECARWLSGTLFLGFGLACLSSSDMVDEFARLGMSSLRLLTGWLEIAGALGLLAALVWPVLLVPAAVGLVLLMVSAVMVRVRAGDTLVQMMPAVALIAMNAFLAVWA
ncbi:MAG: hypothetical protein ACI9EF_002072 [Pseudohongiellaceae bacterium]|jgi:hypothetical protein